MRLPRSARIHLLWDTFGTNTPDAFCRCLGFATKLIKKAVAVASQCSCQNQQLRLTTLGSLQGSTC